ncbi:DUF928 domain-containing protein [Nostoc sp. LEGE 06077]|uniref:DUF928 domain-containing protein n=1 Tax=Nostoc sp. LEGE 06077 TaxID=915325 RepID=UPI0018811669|nr:DUF928 domain-containing protein [Nostoc sp. LEGE 06077]MBE9209723.1 DUF928 domain-containing protein [Nostoc sp. LEGE 06077]
MMRLIGLGLVWVLAVNQGEVHSSSIKQSQLTPSRISAVIFNQPPLSSRGAPGNRQGGGTRDGRNCAALDIKERLTAIVPVVESPPKINNVWGLTVSASPTFWFYVPYLAKDIQAAELELWDETSREPRNYQQIYQGTFTVKGTPGAIALSLPSTVKLETDKNYHWYLSLNINCNGEDESINVNGWIQRVKFQHTALVNRQQVILYAQKGIWYDALTQLAQLRRRNPKSKTLVTDWHKLLKDVGLKEIANKPLVPCCTLE